MDPETSELEQFLERHPDVEQLDAFVIDLCGNAVGKRLPRGEFEKLFVAGTPACAAMQLVDVLGNTADPMGHGFSDGDPDAWLRPVAGMLAPVPWAGPHRAQALCEYRSARDGGPLWYEPRQVLKRVAARFEELGIRPVVAEELEFYLIDPVRAPGAAPVAASSPRTRAPDSKGRVLSIDKLDEFDDVLSGIEQACRAQGVPTTTTISEYGAGQFEINLKHQDDPVRAADHAALLRRAVQGVARARDLDATFMSKPFAGESGSGLHVHLSLEDEAGRNLFDPESKHGDRMLSHAVAGLQATMGEAMAIFAPNVNVYRRFKPDQFVPVTRDWGENNRSVAFRLPVHDREGRRLEHRVAGAEANPYLVMAAVLAGVHHGLVNKMDAGEKHSGNAGAEVDEKLPLTPWDAFRAMENATILSDYVGADYTKIYAQVKRAEFDAFMEDTFEREFDWYL
ncbi:MAG: glutamine synthetase family protein [Gammaproteobacteria bacterium]|nr:glutamine synthetase family protein [Gammaproteobacteria bacterium]